MLVTSDTTMLEPIECAMPRIPTSVQPRFDKSISPKKTKCRLTGREYDEAFTNYWGNRQEDAPARDKFVDAAMEWVVYAILFYTNDAGLARNHEIKAKANTNNLVEKLYESSERIMKDPKRKVEMRPVTWWDVQENFHNVQRSDIDRLSEDLHEPLIFEAIERLKETRSLYWHSGVWTLSSSRSRQNIQRLKQRGRLFLAPKPSKRCRLYVA